MATTARKLQPAIDDSQWLTVDEAAPLMGCSLRHMQRVAKAKAELTHGRLARLAPPSDGNSKNVWWVHRSLDARLDKVIDDETRKERALISLHASGYPEHAVGRALAKSRWLRRWLDLCNGSVEVPGPRLARTTRDLAELVVREAKHAEGDDFSIGVRSLQLWKQQYYEVVNGHIQGVLGLVDKYVGHGRPGKDGTTPDSVAIVGRSPEAVEFFYAAYRTRRQLSLKLCHEMTLLESAKNGWKWSSGYEATARWLKKCDNREITCRFREGREEWSRKYLPSIPQDWTAKAPGEFYVCDHHECDFWVQDGDEQYRPWLTAIQDCRTRMIVGWQLSKSPNQDTIIAALRRAFSDYAIPKTMRIDNGRDFCSKVLTGMTKTERDQLRRELGQDWRKVMRRDASAVDCQVDTDKRWLGILHELDIKLIFAIPYHPWAKGTLERWFGTFEGQCGKLFVSYCGRDATRKPDYINDLRAGIDREERRRLRSKHGKNWRGVARLQLVERAALPTMEQARKSIAEYLVRYHGTKHKGYGLDGRSPAACWVENQTSIRRAAEDELLFLMQGRGVYKVGGNGVSFVVGSGTQSYGRDNPALRALAGREVFISYDPDQAAFCCAWTPDPENRRFIARLDRNVRIDPDANSEDVREAQRVIARGRRVDREAKQGRLRRLQSEQQVINEFAQRRKGVLNATGTDDVAVVSAPTQWAAPTQLVPVRTGFEGTSRAIQSSFEAPAPRPYEHIDVAALFADEGDEDESTSTREAVPWWEQDDGETDNELRLVEFAGDTTDVCEGG